MWNRVLELARLGLPGSLGLPPFGALSLFNGQVVGEGWRARHSTVDPVDEALQQGRVDLLMVTSEPITAPAVNTLKLASLIEPKALDLLRNRGFEVELAPWEVQRKAHRLHRVFLKQEAPYITVGSLPSEEFQGFLTTSQEPYISDPRRDPTRPILWETESILQPPSGGVLATCLKLSKCRYRALAAQDIAILGLDSDRPGELLVKLHQVGLRSLLVHPEHPMASFCQREGLVDEEGGVERHRYARLALDPAELLARPPSGLRVSTRGGVGLGGRHNHPEVRLELPLDCRQGEAARIVFEARSATPEHRFEITLDEAIFPFQPVTGWQTFALKVPALAYSRMGVRVDNRGLNSEMLVDLEFRGPVLFEPEGYRD